MCALDSATAVKSVLNVHPIPIDRTDLSVRPDARRSPTPERHLPSGSGVASGPCHTIAPTHLRTARSIRSGWRVSSPSRTSGIAIPGSCSGSSPAGCSSPGPSRSCVGPRSSRSAAVGGRVSRRRGVAGRGPRRRSFRLGRAYFRRGRARLMLRYRRSHGEAGEQQHKHERVPENVFTLRDKIHRELLAIKSNCDFRKRSVSTHEQFA
jgi:hypothetical protein